MPDFATPDSIIKLLDAIRTQVDVITTLSSAGVAVIIFVWGGVLGIFDNANFSNFKKSALLKISTVCLIFPMLCLILAIIAGYGTGTQITGYYTEMARGMNSFTGENINDARGYFFDSYDNPLHYTMLFQFWASVIGIILLVGWFVWNVCNTKRNAK